MNNLTFGDQAMGYYETICGGAGAGPGWHGRSGVHTHMTNTRITDPEILERRFPVVLHAFSLRDGSGGSGRWRGGDGVVREVSGCIIIIISMALEIQYNTWTLSSCQQYLGSPLYYQDRPGDLLSKFRLLAHDCPCRICYSLHSCDLPIRS